jgi:hypothetical protein
MSALGQKATLAGTAARVSNAADKGGKVSVILWTVNFMSGM